MLESIKIPMADFKMKIPTIKPATESKIGIFKINVNTKPSNTLTEISTSLRMFTALAMSIELSIFFPLRYWYHAKISLPTIEKTVT